MNKPAQQYSKDSLLTTEIEQALLLSLTPLMPTSARIDPLRSRVLTQPGLPPAAPGFHTVRATQGTWQTIAPLVEIKLLHEDAQGSSLLMRLQAGARLPPHQHAANEECLMLEGEGTIGDIHLRAGDFHLAHKGQLHGETYSATGALLFIRTAA